MALTLGSVLSVVGKTAFCVTCAKEFKVTSKSIATVTHEKKVAHYCPECSKELQLFQYQTTGGK